MRIFGNYSKGLTVIGIDMGILLFNGFLLLGFVVATDVLVLDSDSEHTRQVRQINKGLKKCYHHKGYHSLLEARCESLDLDDLPLNLNEGIQVLNAKHNRVRELKNETLASYKKLIYLYLNENFILTIEEGAFVNQRYLEVLDLTMNGFDSVPKNVFELPYLRILYLGENKLPDSMLKVKVTSPLKVLHVSKNRLTKIPYMGPFPFLQNLNLSMNTITAVSTEDLAPFCSLKNLDLSKNFIEENFNTKCECQTVNAWLEEHDINLKYNDSYKGFDCTKKDRDDESNRDCINVQFSNLTYELYNECSAIVQQKIQTEKARSVWILVVSCVSAFLFVIFVVLFFVHKRNRRQRRKQKEQQQLAANNANTELLKPNNNSNLKPGNS